MKTARNAGCFIFWEARPLTNKYVNKELRRGFLKYLVLKILFLQYITAAEDILG